ncbi:MAG TPA: hypothetical protein VH560_13180 [Polyangia bacterium]|jgi:hypothetical protein|nr:hypothetical protein [Polyangia bacterium]
MPWGDLLARDTRRRIGLVVSLASLAIVGAACDGPGNSGKTIVDPNLVREVPWLNGVTPGVDGGVAVVPSTAVYPPIASGEPDPGSQRVDCSMLANLEFAQFPNKFDADMKRLGWFDDFEPPLPGVGRNGGAPGWSAYDDLTKDAWHAPGDFTWYPGLMGTIDWEWGLPSEHTPGPSCDGTPNNWVMHYRGGLFRNWGGGVSHAFTDPVGSYRASQSEACAVGDDFCPAPIATDATVDSAGLPTMDDKGAPLLQSHDFFDVSTYDGIAFWARRGPEGHDQVLVILTDKFTSGRLARQNQKYCRRYRQCYPTCLSGTPCTPVLDDSGTTVPVNRCFDPATGPFPTIAIDSQRDLMFPRCGPSACTSPATYSDLDFDNKACRPYSFPSNDQSGYFCWNEGDPPPPDRDEQCQDGWQTSVQLNEDWTFYALPWSQFGQGGFGKVAPYMDLKSLDTIAFGATMGWSDMYFDNVTLYRRKN